MSPRLLPGLALLLALALAVPNPAVAAYKVGKGETYEDVARNEFGDPSLANLIALHNGLSPDSPPPKGTKLRFPKGKIIQLMIPQRYDSLAFRLLGDDLLGTVLAALNGKVPTDPVNFRESVVVPALIHYERRTGESLEDVARRAYGPGGQAWPIGMANPTPRDVLLVPVIGFFREDLSEREQELAKAATRRLRTPLPSAPPPTADPSDPPTDIAAIRPPDPEPELEAKPPVPTATPEPAPKEPARAAVEVTPAREPDPAPEPRQAEPSASTPRNPEPSPPPSRPRVERSPEPREPDPTPPPSPPELAQPAPTVLESRVIRSVLAEPIPWPPLERVRQDFRFGEYHRAQVAAERLLDAGEVPEAHASTAWLLVGLCRLAREEVDPAVAAFRRARLLEPGLTLDPYFHAPKVRQTFDRAAPAG